MQIKRKGETDSEKGRKKTKKKRERKRKRRERKRPAERRWRASAMAIQRSLPGIAERFPRPRARALRVSNPEGLTSPVSCRLMFRTSLSFPQCFQEHQLLQQFPLSVCSLSRLLALRLEPLLLSDAGSPRGLGAGGGEGETWIGHCRKGRGPP